MIQKKVCMLGSFSVGKTSLVRQYVDSIFNDKYHTTVGVKIDKKQMDVDGETLNMMLWDVAGEDSFSSIRPAHLRGMAGYVIVIDGTRKQSFEVAFSIHEMVKGTLGDLPLVFALNKADLKDQWLVTDAMKDKLLGTGYPVLDTSARENYGVDELFLVLARQMLHVETTGEGAL